MANSVARNGKLRTTRSTDHTWDLDAGEQLLKTVLVDVTGGGSVLWVVSIVMRSDLRLAAQAPGAAKVCEALGYDIGHLQAGQDVLIVIVRVVVVPLVALGMDKHCHIVQVIVVLDDVPFERNVR